uniref:DNA/RNA-binding domain-containing protein n=1 Tax=Panagrolaimus sp. PS1159 TaxID=55785 RepID=A0AC35G6U5_9BILA
MEESTPEKPETPVIVHVNKAKNVLKKLQSEMKDIAPDGLDDEDIINLRKKLVYECEKTFVDSEWRQKMYPLLWINAFYNTIFVYRGAWKLNQGLKQSEKEGYKTFVKKAKSYLLRLSKTYPDLSYSVFNSIGDIHRYSSEILKDSEELKYAIKYYGYAVKENLENGHPFNQLGLLLKANSTWKSVIMFLRAGISAEPYSKAVENLNLIKSEYFEKLHEISMEYMLEMFNPFSRILLDGSKKKWIEHLKAELEEDKPNYRMILESFAVIVLGSLNAMVNDRGNDDRQRYLITAIAEDFKLLFKEFGDILRNSPVEDRIKKRFREARARRKAKNAEDSDDDEEDDEEYKLFSDEEKEESEEEDEESDSVEINSSLDPVLPLLSLLIEWYHFIDFYLISKRPSVALRMTLQTMSQLIIDTTNKYIDHLQLPPSTTSSTKVIWLLKTPGMSLPESFYHQLIPILLKSAETWNSFPIYFERYYKPLGKNHDLSTMREMARLQLEHSTTDDTTTFLPTYYLLEADVIRTRLYVVKALVADKANLLISKSTMRKFDKLKSKDQDARTAVRYLEEKTKSGEIKLLIEDFDRSLEASEAFLSSLENLENVSLLILSNGNQALQKYPDSVIAKEGVDKFFTRYSAMKRRK